MRKINIIGACSDLGLHIDGTKHGPELLEANIDNSSNNNIINVYPNSIEKDLAETNLKKNLSEIVAFNSKLYIEVLNALDNDFFPLVLGGDHSIAIGSALASIKKYNNLGIIWFDAHGDFNTFATTTTGNIHGLPFAVVCNYEKSDICDFHDGSFFNPQNAVLVGARDLDIPDELDNLKKAGVTIYTTEDIKKYGAECIYEKAFEIASKGTNGIHVSFDIDVIDPNIAPGVSVPSAEGVTLEEADCFVDYIIKNKSDIRSVDLVEFNPEHDIEKRTEQLAVEIIDKLTKNL